MSRKNCLIAQILILVCSCRVLGTPFLGCETKTSMRESHPWEVEYRIPQETQPLNYDLYLFPNLETDRFSGHVDITINSTKPRDHFLTHVKFLNVIKTVLKDEQGNVVDLSEAFEYKANEFWVVKTKAEVPAGTYNLLLEFNGRLDNGILGFYKSVYTDKDGKQHKIATSKFQPTYARRAFPCFDEPSFKSTFKTTLVKPSGSEYRAISNMPEESTRPDSPEKGYTEVTFELSAPMVTYLAIFVVCDFEYLETSNSVVPFKVYGTAEQKNRLQYAMEIGASIALYYEQYFNVKYPLPKLDMAAIPDYSSGATEHWGLITFRETNLIYDPMESSSANKERVADVIAHELAHQWFGNLMTVFWWNDLWLNEGFATYIEYKGVKSYETTWDTDSRFLTNDLHRVLELDATFGSHPIVVEVNSPDEINAVFDTISYSKGASVIRMMENFLGENDFRKGLNSFLEKYSFKSAVTQDLLDELTAASSEKLDVTKIMDTWTRQKGFPVLNVSRKSDKYVIRQERFLANADMNSNDDAESPFGYKWEVPVTFFTSKDSETRQKWFHLDDDVLEIPIVQNGWTKLNAGQFGYYRVNYPTEDWEAFVNLLNKEHERLTISDRTSLLNDAFALAKGGRLRFAQALDLTMYLGPKERASAPWQTAFLDLDKIASILYFTPTYYDVNGYIISLIELPYKELGWDEVPEESDAAKGLRTFVLDKACSYGYDKALKQAGELLLTKKNDGAYIPPNMRSIVYCHGMKFVGDKAVWEWMFDLYKKEANAQEKLKLMRGLTCISEPWLLSHMLDLARDETNVRSQDYFTLLNYMSLNKVGEPIVWDFVRNNWEYLVTRFSLNDRLMGRMISFITQNFATEMRLLEMKAFFKKYPEAGAGEQYRRIAIETVENNIKFLVDGGADEVRVWLDNH